MKAEAPRWDDPGYSAGSMVRGALWLVQVVGEGNTFTKNQLRDAFPGVSQIDRRIRDLRDYGWVVYSNTEDAGLSAEDQRFVKEGVAVWDAKARRDSAPQKAISSKERQAILARDSYMCTLCGIAGGEPYPDDAILTAVLSVSRRTLEHADGRKELALVTECNRCRAGLGGDDMVSIGAVISAVRDLEPREQRRIARWMERGRRGTTELDRAWTAFLRVPFDNRQAVIDGVSAGD
ncbi:hypothetical protein [Agromyces larvae]|uniref:HNH endonuclease n=1 Tax=Agromyces larvae TaxID=2929802 RepID=A0ABY4C0E6_9MICO|nr:hypothetical protein [Agromyces larvae]UOE44963.1 hypothetical protein MTO99_04060 [Agromyces larvae]